MTRRYRRRPRAYVRTPGCGCVGCSIPLLMFAAVIALVVAFA